MKKKNLFLCFVLIISMASAAACRAGSLSLNDGNEYSSEQSAPAESAEEESAGSSEDSGMAQGPEDPPSPLIHSAGQETEYEDTSAPFLLNIVRNVSLITGEDFDIGDYISYIDDSDPEVDLFTEGEVDTSAAGTYTVSFSLTDDAGNVTNDSITVNVIYPPSPQSGETESSSDPVYYPSYTGFDVFSGTYAQENIHCGIDVSRWQGDIRWNEVRDSGCEFAMIRAGWSSGGVLHEDEYFRRNLQGASEAGIPIGIYVYTEDETSDEVTAVANEICDALSDYDIRLPIVFDWEDFYSGFQNHNLSMRDLNDLYHVFGQCVENRGYEAMLYGSKYILEAVWDNDIEGVWLAHYAASTDYGGDYIMWQQSSNGSIGGIDGAVDLDLYYGPLP